MFETKKTLIVVYKDELLMNQLKKMVESHDDTEDGVIGTRDDSINIVSWTEKVWLGNKKAGNIQGKILFLGEVKGTDKLIPVIDAKFDDCGVKYGWAGNQAVLFVDPKALTNREGYDSFLKKLSDLPVPDFLKTWKEEIKTDEPEEEQIETLPEDAPAIDETESDHTVSEKAEKKHSTPGFFKAVKKGFDNSTEAISKMGKGVAAKTEELFRDKSLMKRQMLFYGVVHLYNDGLDRFMNQ
jgi:hypothetical protein